MKPQNILVNQYASALIIDTDSFQVRHPQTKEIYHCLVGSEEFTPPELLEKELAKIVQTPTHDNFRLALIIAIPFYLCQKSYRFLGIGNRQCSMGKSFRVYF